MLTILTIAYHAYQTYITYYAYHHLPRLPYLHHLLCFRRRTGGCGSSPLRLQCRSPSSFTWTRCRVTREACGAPGRQCSAIIGCGALAASRRIQQAHATAGLCHRTAPPTQRLPIPSHATLHVLAAARACCCACLLLHVLAAARACCCTCLLLHVLAAARACCCACLLLRMLAAARACCCTCLLLHVLAAARACCCTCLLLRVRACLPLGVLAVGSPSRTCLLLHMKPYVSRIQNISSLLCQLPELGLKRGYYLHSSFMEMAIFNAIGAVQPVVGLSCVSLSLRMVYL